MATQMVRCQYEEIIDLHTESDTVTAIGIHTPTGKAPQRMFPGFFKQFKKYKYLGASLKFLPVATLPADPLQVSYEAGEPSLDPRDLANPILIHGCHGDDLGTILNTLYTSQDQINDSMDGMQNIFDAEGVSSDNLTSLYYRALTDRSWKKANVQRGFVKGNLRPLVYNVVSNHQIMPGMGMNDDGIFQTDQVTPSMQEYPVPLGEYDLKFPAGNSRDLRMMTNRLTGLGWIDTRSVLTDPVVDFSMETWMAMFPKMEGETDGHWARRLAMEVAASREKYVELEKIFMCLVLLPPCYKQELYFRAFVTHYFAFKDFRGISMQNDMLDVPTYRNANEGDLFDPDDGRVPGGAPTGGVPDPDPPSYRKINVNINNNGSDGTLRWVVFFNDSPVYQSTVTQGTITAHTFEGVTVGTVVKVGWMDDETILPAGDAYPQDGIVVQSGESAQNMVFSVVQS